MTELVLLHHNEPMTTSLAIAEGVQLQHKNVIELIRKHIEPLSNFGRVAFETRPFETDGGNQWRDVAYLNEPQSTLLITFMRNSEIVIAFKIALVKAFFELRDHVKSIQPTFTTTNLSHGADLAVAADRTFRSFLRAARAAGMALPQALRVANRHTVERTGMDMLAELEVDPDDVEQRTFTQPPEEDPVRKALTAWAETAEAGRYFSMADILAEAFGVKRDSKDAQRISVKAGNILRGLGFVHRKMSYGGRLVNLWEKKTK